MLFHILICQTVATVVTLFSQTDASHELKTKLFLNIYSHNTYHNFSKTSTYYIRWNTKYIYCSFVLIIHNSKMLKCFDLSADKLCTLQPAVCVLNQLATYYITLVALHRHCLVLGDQFQAQFTSISNFTSFK